IAWQSQVAEIKQALHLDETRIDRRQAEIDERGQVVEATSAQLARQAEELLQQERVVAERRGEMNRHLADMREWDRKKLRELARVDEPPDGDPAGAAPNGSAVVVPMPPAEAGEADADGDLRPAAEVAGTERGILSLTPEVDPGDRQLGDLLRSL